MTSVNETNDIFPLSRKKKVNGTRRLAREKVLQILISHKISGTPVDQLYKHIFFREFNFGDEEEVQKYEKLLKPDEVFELEADIPIEWREDDMEFANTLIKLCLTTGDYLDALLKEHAENWELERIALIDRYLMHIAIAEMINFPDIPPKVSLNEAIDIAKVYSTDKSGVFINGVLDTLMDKFKREGAMKKEGRGLLED